MGCPELTLLLFLRVYLFGKSRKGEKNPQANVDG